MATSCQEVAVVAIDFGTTYSGYAYSFHGEYQKDPNKISCNIAWSTGTNVLASLKTPTAILLKWNKKKREFEKVDFGYDAQRRYAEMEEAKRSDHVIADRFKMELYSESADAGLRRNFKLTLANGEQIKAMRLISMFIEYLKDHFLQAVEKKGVPLKVSLIRWVLTVPAIWTDGAKQFMREAAEMAGISSSMLTIVFEPEAAALHCLFLEEPVGLTMKPILKQGGRYLVIDAGGGTVDFTVLEMTVKAGSQGIEIKREASGGPWGGTVVDENFRAIFVGIVGQDAFDSFATDHRDDYFELNLCFEGLKRRNLGKDQEKTVIIKIPVSIAEAYENRSGKSLVSAAEAKYGVKVKIDKDKLRIDREMVLGLFKGPCEEIVKHTGDLLRTSESIDAILLVGGFGSSGVVQKYLKEKFPKCHIIIPDEPELAVVKGAVHYGNNPETVKSRMLRYTYGTEICKKFDEEKHPESKKREYDGRDNCIDIFDVHARKGQVVKIGQVESRKSYRPVSTDSSFMMFEIYATRRSDPMFVTDRGCKQIGEFTIDLPGRGLDRVVQAEMSFGETELVVKATEKKSGKSVSTNLNFLDIDD